MRRSWLLLLALLMAGTGLAACGGSAGTSGSKEVVFAQGVDAVNMDPAMDSSITAFSAHNQIFDRLIERDKDLKLVPKLATEWKLVAPTTWEIKLRSGVKFHNGEPFDAQSVKFSLERILNPDTKSPKRPWVAPITAVNVVDATTVRITTNAPDPALPSRLTLVHAVPPKYVAEKGNEFFAQNAVGTGPYKLVRWVKGDVTELEANSDYWGEAPKIKKARIRIIPDGSARVAALEAGEIHIIANLPPDDIARLPKDKVQAKDVPSVRVIYIGLINTKGTPLDKKEVRQAINYAVDKKALIDKILLGYGIETANAVPNVVFGFNEDVKPYPFDPAKAKELLAQAGYPNGFEITLSSPSGRYLKDTEIAQAIVGQLEQVGIRVKLQTREWTAFLQTIGDKTVEPMYLLGWGSPSGDPDGWLSPNFENGQYWTAGYQLPDDINRLIAAGRSEVDEAKRKAVYNEFAAKLKEEAPRLFLYQQKDIYGVATSLNWEPRSDEMVIFADMSWK